MAVFWASSHFFASVFKYSFLKEKMAQFCMHTCLMNFLIPCPALVPTKGNQCMTARSTAAGCTFIFISLVCRCVGRAGKLYDTYQSKLLVKFPIFECTCPKLEDLISMHFFHHTLIFKLLFFQKNPQFSFGTASDFFSNGIYRKCVINNRVYDSKFLF